MERMMKKTIIVFSVAALALLGVGSVFDLSITSALYNPESGFAKLFQVAGVLPQFALIVLSPAMVGAFVLVQRKAMERSHMWTLIFCTLVMTVNVVGDAMNDVADHLPIPRVGIAFIFALLIALCVPLARPFAKKAEDTGYEFLVVALIGLCACFAGDVIIDSLKVLWARRRFYTMTDPATQFTAWYVTAAGGAKSDEYMSFPSGHAFASTLALWFALFPRFIPALRKFTRLIFGLALLFALTTMVSRLVYGRHFLSDVTVGSAIALLCLAIARVSFDRHKQELIDYL
jgi:membrane-associated phospholipid phosphatase